MVKPFVNEREVLVVIQDAMRTVLFSPCLGERRADVIRPEAEIDDVTRRDVTRVFSAADVCRGDGAERDERAADGATPGDAQQRTGRQGAHGVTLYVVHVHTHTHTHTHTLSLSLSLSLSLRLSLPFCCSVSLLSLPSVSVLSSLTQQHTEKQKAHLRVQRYRGTRAHVP